MKPIPENELPPRRGFLRRFFSSGALRRALIGLVGFDTLIALVVTEENWRGKHDWEIYRHEQEAKGEHFDWQAFAPPTVPDDQNFFTAPITTNMIAGQISMTPYGKDGGPDLRQDAKRRGYAVYLMHFTDLENWQKYYRHPAIPHTVDGFSMTNGELTAQTNFNVHVAGAFPIGPQPQTAAKYVLLALSKFDSAVEELRQASHRPYANIPENYAGGFDAVSPLLPIFAELKSCSQLLQLRVSAELANGQNTKALDDVKLSLYLGNSLRNSPFLISFGKVWQNMNGRTVNWPNLIQIWPGLTFWPTTDLSFAGNGHLRFYRLNSSVARMRSFFRTAAR
jgi:hypothetical protein